MSQINVNSPAPVDGEKRATSAGVGILAIVLVAIVAVVVLWLLFSGLFAGPSSSTTNVNVNPPAQPAQERPAQKDSPSININVPKIEVNPPAQQPAAPSKP
jgi:hypothetical protein